MLKSYHLDHTRIALVFSSQNDEFYSTNRAGPMRFSTTGATAQFSLRAICVSLCVSLWRSCSFMSSMAECRLLVLNAQSVDGLEWHLVFAFDSL